MTRIVDVRVHHVAMPLNAPFATSNKVVVESQIVLVHLRTASGLSGWGEAPLNPTFTHETPLDTRDAIERFGRAELLGVEVTQAFARLPELASALGTRVAARCALSIALWDLYARLAEVPVHALLGAARRAAVPVVFHLGHFDGEQDAAAARAALERGFTTFKLKVGRPDVSEDLAAVAQVRQAVGSNAAVIVDANQAWGRHQAAAFMACCRELGVAAVEQPLARWDHAGSAKLGATPGVVVTADESLYDSTDLLSALVAGMAPAGAVVKLLKTGGLEGARDLLRLCDLASVVAFPAGMPGDTSLISAAMLHLAVTVRELPLGTAITPHFSRHDIVTDPLRVADGQLHLKALRGPGLGVEVDQQRVEQLAAT